MQFFFKEFKQQIKLLDVTQIANKNVVQHKLYLLQENVNILKEIGGREQMEDILSIKLKLNHEKNIDLMYDIINERKFEKSPPKITTK